MEVVLYTTYYDDPNPKRNAELIECRMKNAVETSMDIAYLIDRSISWQATNAPTRSLFFYTQSERATFRNFLTTIDEY